MMMVAMHRADPAYTNALADLAEARRQLAALDAAWRILSETSCPSDAVGGDLDVRLRAIGGDAWLLASDLMDRIARLETMVAEMCCARRGRRV
jgi:hypothetical protein